MITADAVAVRLTERELLIVKEHAEALAEMRGKSQFLNAEQRAARRAADDYTGQVGEAALSKLITGSIQLYHLTRLQKEQDPLRGDDGSDLQGYRLDVKTSRMTAGAKYDYHLWIRPREFHAGITYLLALMFDDGDYVVFFVGWARADEIPKVGERYELRQDRLRSMSQFWYRDHTGFLRPVKGVNFD